MLCTAMVEPIDEAIRIQDLHSDLQNVVVEPPRTLSRERYRAAGEPYQSHSEFP